MMTQIVTKKLIDATEVRRTLKTLFVPGQVFELRVLEASTDPSSRYTDTLGGYFDNIEDALRAIAPIRKALGFYVTPQVCHPDLLGRACNKLIKQKKDYSTPDKYITRYRWLLIDCDPERVSQISSTDKLHEQALKLAQDIKAGLKTLGWSDPIEGDSGNGGHLEYLIDLENTPDNIDLLKRTLEGLAARFDIPGIHIDKGVYNPSRIWKLYGTRACKGDDTTKWPHRMSRLINVPDELVPVSLEQLNALAVPVPEQQAPRPAQKKKTESGKATTKSDKPGTPDDALQWLEKWMAKYKIAIVGGKVPYDGGYKWQVAQCCFCGNSDHNAFIYFVGEKYGYKCSHNSCSSKHWTEFRDHHEIDASEDDDEQPSQVTQLERIVTLASYLRTPSGALFARVPVNGHHEVVSINEKGSGFRRWLVYQYKRCYGTAPYSDAMTLVMSGVLADAEYTGQVAKVHTRIAEHNGCIYLDLADDTWQCIEISSDGYRVITEPPVFFRRPNGMLPLPVPQEGGSLEDLKQIVQAKSQADYMLITAWLIGALHPRGPYPVLNINGERGSAKTYTTNLLRKIIDPNEALTRPSPKDPQAAAIMAQNNMVVALDNLSTLPLWLSDVLCRIATRSGYGTRELYENDREIVFNTCRPIILNGIEDGIISQGDLLNRTMMVTLSRPENYKTEEELDQVFESLHPQLLGALLKVVSSALNQRSTFKLEKLPRMADFARWVVSTEPLLGWEPGAFMNAYDGNQESASSIILEASPVAKALLQFMSKRNHEEWSGYTEELYQELAKFQVFSDAKNAPKNARALGGNLRRIAPSMLVQGIHVSQLPRDSHGSKVALKVIEKTPPDKNSSSVANHVANSENVANHPENVAKKDLLHSSEHALHAAPSQTSVANGENVAKSPSFTSLSEDPKKEEKREKTEETVKDRNFATFAPFATQAQLDAEEQALHYVRSLYRGTACHCGCRLKWYLHGEPVCANCEPCSLWSDQGREAIRMSCGGAQ